MNDFKDREKSFEKKYVLDQEKEFRIQSRRNKYLGEWASKIMQLDESKIKDYIQAVIKSDFEKPGDDDVFQKLKKDLVNFNKSDKEIRSKMDELYEKAKKEIS
jgi:hypothetical protein